MAGFQNFFYRAPTAGGPVTAMGTIGSGLPITEIKNYKFKLTINGGTACIHGGFQSAYQYNEFRASKTGYLTGATVTIEGTAGSLVRVEAKWKIHRDQLDAVDAAFLQIGARGTVSYSRDGTGGSEDSHELRVYDCSFTINQDNTVDVQVKCIGASQQSLYVNLYAGFSKAFGNLQFRGDYNDDGFILLPVQNIVDLIDHTVQTGTDTMNSIDFAPIDTGNAGNWKVRYNALMNTKLFESEYGFDQDLLTQAERGIYVTLGWIIENINTAIGPTSVERGTLVKLRATAEMSYDPIGLIPSANPIECIFNYHADKGPIAYTNNGSVPPTDSMVTQGYNAIGNDPFGFDVGTNLGDILINRNVIAGILKESTAIKTSPGIIKMFPLKEYFLTVETFYKKLLGVINANSGGALDLDIVLDPKQAIAGGDDVDLIIINNRGKEQQPTPFEFKKGMVAIREVSITSKVPSATAAAAFSFDKNSAANTADASDNAAAAGAAGKSIGQSSQIPTAAELADAKMAAAGAYFSSETCDGIRGILRRVVNGQSTAATVDKTSVPWPLELKLTIVGVAGWRFGDTITYNDLPARYRDANGTIKVGFTTIRVQHMFGEEWTTDLITQCRFVGH